MLWLGARAGWSGDETLHCDRIEKGRPWGRTAFGTFKEAKLGWGLVVHTALRFDACFERVFNL